MCGFDKFRRWLQALSNEDAGDFFEREIVNRLAATFWFKLTQIPDFALPDDLQASRMYVVREPGESESEFLNSRRGQLALLRSAVSSENSQLKLGRGVCQEFADGNDRWLACLFTHHRAGKGQVQTWCIASAAILMPAGPAPMITISYMAARRFHLPSRLSVYGSIRPKFPSLRL